jgi:hypothetical protein
VWFYYTLYFIHIGVIAYSECLIDLHSLIVIQQCLYAPSRLYQPLTTLNPDVMRLSDDDDDATRLSYTAVILYVH